MELKIKNAIHKKTGNKYQVIADESIDCTNYRDVFPVVIYYRDGMFFVREKAEFIEKFEI